MSFHLLTKTYNGQSYVYSEIRVACRLGLYAIFAHAVTYNHMRCRRWMGVFSRDGKWSVVKGARGSQICGVEQRVPPIRYMLGSDIDCALRLQTAWLYRPGPATCSPLKSTKEFNIRKNDEVYIQKSRLVDSHEWTLTSKFQKVMADGPRPPHSGHLLCS